MSGVVRGAWWDASPFSRLGGYGSGYWREQPIWYRVLTRLFILPHRVAERGKALWHLVRPDEGCDYLGLRARLLTVAWLLLPIHWHYPSERKCGWPDEVTSWDGASWNGGEMTCWEATFIAIPRPFASRRFGLAHIYREGGP